MEWEIKILTFEALCTKTCKLSLEAMLAAFWPNS